MKLSKVSIETILENQICRQLGKERAINREAVSGICTEESIDQSELATAIRVISKLYSQTDCKIHLLVAAIGENLGGNPRYNNEVLLAEDLAANMLYVPR
jgi:hypothetical protein